MECRPGNGAADEAEGDEDQAQKAYGDAIDNELRLSSLILRRQRQRSSSGSMRMWW